MKKLSIVSGILASLLWAAAGLAVAQDQHQNERPQTAPPAENRKDDARPQDRRNEDRSNDDRRNQEPGSGDRRPATPQNEQQQSQPPQSGDHHPQSQQDEHQRQQPAARQNQPQEQQNPGQQEREKDRHEPGQPQGQMREGDRARGEGHEESQRRIPDSDFRAHFGREHRFAPGRMQVYQGRPQFTYGGYVFELVEAWPADWVYDDDDYYVDYVDDEYWLYSFRHPGVRLQLMIIG